MTMMISVCNRLLYHKFHLVSYLNECKQLVLIGRVKLICGWGDGAALIWLRLPIVSLGKVLTGTRENQHDICWLKGLPDILA
jgi:hypothetical protein